MKKLDMSFIDIVRKRALIYGDVGVGKTRLMVLLLEEAVNHDFTPEITIVDMAPKTSIVRGIRVGGRLSETTDLVKRVRYLAPRKVETPRLTAKNGEELLILVEKNRRRIARILRQYMEKPTSILFINDVSIYLQSGDFETLMAAIDEASTLVANGYYGKTLSNDHSTGISTIERDLMEKLIVMMDVKIRL